MPHRRSLQKRLERREGWCNLLDILRKRALNTAYLDRELRELVATSETEYYPGMETGEVLSDTRGRGSLQ